ncbi:hypothetical protein [Radiobacillus sp. PE A8.2]|uniref:hypothetical protein n=1 Tax=Radiobacillus sp. PE A8.2 TaxID=3380349 RepID=UPI00388F1ACA
MRKKHIIFFSVGIISALLVIFWYDYMVTDLSEVMKSEDYNYIGPEWNEQPFVPFESITSEELQTLEEKETINLSEEHTFYLDSTLVSYKTMEELEDNIVLRLEITPEFSKDKYGNRYILPSMIVQQDDEYTYEKIPSFEAENSTGAALLIDIDKVDFGVYDIVIEKESVYKSMRIDLFLRDYYTLIVDR